MNYRRFIVLFFMFSIFLVAGAGAVEEEIQIKISGKPGELMNYTFSVSGRMPENTTALLVYSEPEDVLLCSIVSHEAAREETIAILNENPLFSALSVYTDFRSEATVPFSIESVEGVSLYAGEVQDQVIVRSLIATVYSQNMEIFEFGYKPESTGCFTVGRCGNGSWFMGPMCDPCIYTVICSGDYGYILCGYHVLPQ